MKYYLDTESLYQVRKIPNNILSSCFYSVFNLMELIGGINEEEFAKRKSLLKQIISSEMKCDYSFPEEILFNSFNYFKEYEYKEERSDNLFDIIDDIISSSSYNEFLTSTLLKERKYDFYYFVKKDNFMSNNFYESSAKGKAIISEALKNNSENKTVALANKKYDLNSRRKVLNFLDEPYVNSSFTILALADEAERIFLETKKEKTEENIYYTYNGNLDIFIKGFSEYSKYKIIEDSLPMENDFQDLTHLYYLRNSNDIKLVSNDKLFKKCIFGHFISFESLLGGNLLYKS